MDRHIIALSIITFFGLISCAPENNKIQPDDLRTEYLKNPVGLGTRSLRLSWRFEGQTSNLAIAKAEVDIWKNSDQKGTSIQIIKESSNGSLLTSVTLPDTLEPLTCYWWNVAIWDNHGTRHRTSNLASFETAMFSDKEWRAKWISDSQDKEYEPAPLFRKSVEIADKKILAARLFVSAAGYYEMCINGKRLGSSYLDPGYTNFEKRILYSTHDITNLLSKGVNTVSAVLGNGWYNVQGPATWNFHKALWRNRPRLLAEFHIDYADGTEQVIVTDNTWKTSTGACTYNCLYSGDHMDLRLEEKGWELPGFDDSKWQQAMEVPSPSPSLVAQQMPGICITDEFKASDMKKINDRLYVYTFPKNMAGFCRLKVKGAPDTRITLKHGEMLNKDGRLEQGNVNFFFYPRNAGEVFQQDEVILRNADEWVEFMPSFTYHGFQYVEVESSKPVELKKESLTALFVHTGVKSVGSFECSNQTLVKIWEAARQSYLSNLESIPTDCPQREKNGWTADAHISVDLGLLNFDGITVYEKWMDDFIDMQRERGDITAIVPSSGWGRGKSAGPVWDAALFIIPNALYQYYGDSRCIQKMIPTLDRYLAYLEKEEENGLLAFGLGDWVPYKSRTNNTFTSSAYYYLDYKLRAFFAKILGEDDSRFLAKAEKIRRTINDHFFNAGTNTYADGTQTAQALALYMGLAPEDKEKQVAAKLHELVAGNNYFLDFGVIGSKTVPAMLTRYGYVEDAMKMVTKTDEPSWGYWIEKLGYTTLAEQWNPVQDGTSLNHVFLGDVAAWMMNQLAGINFDPQNPGFTHILITPNFVKDLSWVKGRYQSVKGLISSEWKRKNGKIILNVTIPAGCSASVIAGGIQKGEVRAGNHQFAF